MEIRSALLAELRELKYRMAVASYYAQLRFGNVDRAFLQWLRGIVAAYSGPSPAENLLKGIDMQLTLSEQALSALLASEQSQGKSGLELKKYAVPLLDARLAVLTWLRNVRARRAQVAMRYEPRFEETGNSSFTPS